MLRVLLLLHVLLVLFVRVLCVRAVRVRAMRMLVLRALVRMRSGVSSAGAVRVQLRVLVLVQVLVLVPACLCTHVYTSVCAAGGGAVRTLTESIRSSAPCQEHMRRRSRRAL